MLRALLSAALETVPALFVRRSPHVYPPSLLFAPASAAPAYPAPSMSAEEDERAVSDVEAIMKDGFALMAVPKRKPTHSKKRMRMNHKYLKVQHHVETCSACGKSKLHHHLCLHCVSTIREAYRQKEEDK